MLGSFIPEIRARRAIMARSIVRDRAISAARRLMSTSCSWGFSSRSASTTRRLTNMPGPPETASSCARVGALPLSTRAARSAAI